MVTLPYTLETFTPQAWQHTFGAYVHVNHSHWTGVPYEVLMTLLRTNGQYEFGFKAMGTWHSKFRLAVRDDGFLEATFVQNPELTGRMREHLEKMANDFEHKLRST